jgi:large repetitive protein
MIRIVLVSFALSLTLADGIVGTTARADDVTAAVAGGTLKLKGDADPNTLTLDQPALGQVRVTGTTTTINGASGPVVFEGVTGGLQVDLGAGDDTLTLDTLAIAGAVKIKMGAGANTVTITNPTFADAVSIDLGSGDEALQLCGGGGGTVGGKLSIKVGAGAGTPRSAMCDAFGANNPAGSAIVLDSVEVVKTLSLKGSKKSEAVTLQDVFPDADAKLSLGGGSDSLAVCDTSIGESLIVQMGNGAGTMMTASCGGPVDPSGDNALDLDHFTVGAKLSIKMGGAADSVLLTDGGHIQESATFDLGQGANQLTLDGIGITGSLGVKSGKGDDTITIKNGGISASASVNAGAGTNAVTFTAVPIAKNLSVKTGNGDDTIDVSGATVTGSTKITHGKGTDTITPLP